MENDFGGEKFGGDRKFYRLFDIYSKSKLELANRDKRNNNLLKKG